MNVIMFSILLCVGICYFLASEGAMFEYVVPNDDGEYDSKRESKRVIIAILLVPVAVIIGPYFIYKVLKGEDK